MGNTLYLECASGISGDMTVAALLDLGADQEVLEKAIASLPLEGFSIEVSRVKKSGLDACDFLVRLDGEHENHDHDMEYLHGDAAHGHGHVHEVSSHPHEDGVHEHGYLHEDGAYEHGHEEHAHNHFHEDTHMHAEEGHHHGHSHTHRGLEEVLDIISRAELSDRARDTAVRIFTILARAEAKAHGVPLEQVHFHEVGAVDSIVDIVAAAVCLDNLDITEAVVPRICEGRGFVRCQHGVIPVPVPAVVNIAQACRLPLHLTETEGELVTPTGAAIAAAVRTGKQLPESFVIKKTGIGAGKRTYDRPSLLRAMLIEPADARPGDRKDQSGSGQVPAGGYGNTAAIDKSDARNDRVCRLETNIDDCTGENLGYVMERLFEAGARDVHYTPVFMKKNRPAYQLNVICSRELVPEMENIIFRETTTIGIRRIEMERTVLERFAETVQTSLGEAEVKVCTLPDGEKRCYPEYASAKRLAGENGISFRDAFEQIKREARGKLQ